MNKKVYIIKDELSKSRLCTLIKTSTNHRATQRAQAILWSMEGRDRSDLAALFGVKPDTISEWFKRWNPNDFSTLSDEPRAGRPPMLNSDEKKSY
jgi:transposase